MKKTLFLSPFFFLIALVVSGCEPVAVDPVDVGRCYTDGDFSGTALDKSDVRALCRDWATVLASNCIPIEGLLPNPTEVELAEFCFDEVDAGIDASKAGKSFRLDHACNFTETPEYDACVRGGGVALIGLGDPQNALLKANLEASIRASSHASSSVEHMFISYQGTRINLPALLGH